MDTCFRFRRLVLFFPKTSDSADNRLSQNEQFATAPAFPASPERRSMPYLHGIGHFHPENVIDNRFPESLDIGVDANWVRERVGIEERRTVLALDYSRHTRNADPRAADESAQFSNAIPP
jgi:hypothetical protein